MSQARRDVGEAAGELRGKNAAQAASVEGAGKRLGSPPGRADQPERGFNSDDNRVRPGKRERQDGWRERAASNASCYPAYARRIDAGLRGDVRPEARTRGGGAGSATTATTHRVHAMRGAGDLAATLDSHGVRCSCNGRTAERVGRMDGHLSIAAKRCQPEHAIGVRAGGPPGRAMPPTDRVPARSPEAGAARCRRCCGCLRAFHGGTGPQPLRLGYSLGLLLDGRPRMPHVLRSSPGHP